MLGKVENETKETAHDNIRNGQVKNVEVGAAPNFWSEILSNWSLTSS